MSHLAIALVGGVRLTGSAVAVYFGSAVLVALALVPAGLRTFQLFTRNDDGWLEVVVELLRAVLIAVMIGIGRSWSASDFFRGVRWAAVGRDLATAWQRGRLSILVQLGVVTVLILIFNAVFEAVVTVDAVTGLLAALRLDTSYSGATTDATVFAVKNFVVIPVYLLAMLQALAIIGPDPDPGPGPVAV